MKYLGIIFDMDGTIIDTEHIWKEAIAQVIGRRGACLTAEQQQELHNKSIGMALPSSCALLKEAIGCDDSIQDLINEKCNIALSIYAQGVRFIKGFIEFHAQTQHLNLKTGLATNADDATLAITCQILKLERFFGKHMYNISHVENPKPHPDIYLLAAQRLGLSPDQCVAIEDSAHGIAAAQAAGIFCIGINNGSNPGQTAKADLIIDGYHEIDLKALLEIGVK